jgi:hypothetical protein
MALGKGFMKRRLAILFLLLGACASGHCRKATPAPNVADDGKAADADGNVHVFVAKPDGSLQCKKAKGVSVEKMQVELNGIQVFSAVKKPDGLMHVQLCGSPTGMHNVYEILTKDLPAAEKLKFKKWLY